MKVKKKSRDMFFFLKENGHLLVHSLAKSELVCDKFLSYYVYLKVLLDFLQKITGLGRAQQVWTASNGFGANGYLKPVS